jgi:orotate phosphoribosyltransferase-like protein
MSLDDELVERVRTLRVAGCTAKQIARTVGVPAARVTALVREIAAEQAAAQAVDGPRPLVG